MAAARKLGRLMRLLNGIGKPKCLQGDGGFASLRQLLTKLFSIVGTRLADRTGLAGQIHSLNSNGIAILYWPLKADRGKPQNSTG